MSENVKCTQCGDDPAVLFCNHCLPQRVARDAALSAQWVAAPAAPLGDDTELQSLERWCIEELYRRNTSLHMVVGDLPAWIFVSHIEQLTAERATLQQRAERDAVLMTNMERNIAQQSVALDALAATVARVRAVINAAGRTGVYLTPQEVRDALEPPE